MKKTAQHHNRAAPQPEQELFCGVGSGDRDEVFGARPLALCRKSSASAASLWLSLELVGIFANRSRRRSTASTTSLGARPPLR